eukprot:TRINITY_DN5571_c0_g1_i1.p1 TRINITY_DN5571_c0_g1~~TRINITY_DN5571_c0_g1_i1.p1  ORF type:complete len:484 (+),score=97.74 TRINITY_DN5571_c0_g1_i1:137-1588(+)
MSFRSKSPTFSTTAKRSHADDVPLPASKHASLEDHATTTPANNITPTSPEPRFGIAQATHAPSNRQTVSPVPFVLQDSQQSDASQTNPTAEDSTRKRGIEIASSVDAVLIEAALETKSEPLSTPSDAVIERASQDSQSDGDNNDNQDPADDEDQKDEVRNADVPPAARSSPSDNDDSDDRDDNNDNNDDNNQQQDVQAPAFADVVPQYGLWQQLDAPAHVIGTAELRMAQYSHLLMEEESLLRQLQNTPERGLGRRSRCILVDWLVEVQTSFRLTEEVLHLAVSLLVQYASMQPIDRTELQLYAATALWTASKLEEIHPPALGDLVYVCAQLYQAKQFVAAERRLFGTVLNLYPPLAVAYLPFFAPDLQLSTSACAHAQYLTDYSLSSSYFGQVEHVRGAAAAVHLASVSEGGAGWTQDLAQKYQLPLNCVLQDAERLFEHVMHMSNDMTAGGGRSYEGLKTKYNRPEAYYACSLPLLPPVPL